MRDLNVSGGSKLSALSRRGNMDFQLVFHVFYSNTEENIDKAQILSQIQQLNALFSGDVFVANTAIPESFRSLQSKPQFRFCLATRDPLGNFTEGITRHPIADLSLACKREFGKRSIMHRTLGGVDPWDPERFINVYVINRAQCPVLGEAIFPWLAQQDEDGVILHYQAVGFSGAAADFYPYQKGKTLVHELGHYFGLYHLSNDKGNCVGDDLVEDTPTQATEYFGCPQQPAITCGHDNMFMNYMSLVEDDCMLLFTQGQVQRMKDMILQYRANLPVSECQAAFSGELTSLQWSHENRHWMIYHPDGKIWSAHMELFDPIGRLLWKGFSENSSYVIIPDHSPFLIGGIFLISLHNISEQKQFLLFTP